jgi:hypothetical protein
MVLGSLLGFAGQAAAADNIPRLSDADLVEVVAPIALYPDDLVAVVLPAASYPLQLVQAQRVLDDGGSPNADWDEAVVALMNYPEVVEFLNDDLDWTYGLGLAFINQEADVFNAIQGFRADALAAGNLKSDSYQSVRVDNNGNILIEPQAKDTLYVPYYEPRRVVVRHVAPVYHYYPIARPVYYYPYPASYSFNVGHFYGVGTYFSIGWQYRGLNLFYSNGPSHPYAGINYAVRYSPRHYYFTPRARRHVVVNQRHHYKPQYNKRVKHRARHVRADNGFRPAKHVRNNAAPRQRAVQPRHIQNRKADARQRNVDTRPAQRRQLQKPQNRLARDSIQNQQQRKQAKFRDARQERTTFGRKRVAQNNVSNARPRKVIAQNNVSNARPRKVIAQNNVSNAQPRKQVAQQNTKRDIKRAQRSKPPGKMQRNVSKEASARRQTSQRSAEKSSNRQANKRQRVQARR